MTHGNFESKVDGTSTLNFTVEVTDLNQLYSALAEVKKLKAVQGSVCACPDLIGCVNELTPEKPRK